VKHYGDITKINGAEVTVVDIITGGSPCQDLSVAGKRAGLAGERSGLFMEQLRIVKEMRANDRANGRASWMVRPRYMVWENVDGARTSPGGNRKGEDFAAVLEEIIKVCEQGAGVRVRVPDGGWTKSGCFYADDGTWSIAWRVHDAQFWGVPQRRKRIALVADFGGLTAPEILFVRKGLCRDIEEGEKAREEAAGTVGGGIDGASGCAVGFPLGFRAENTKCYAEKATTVCNGTRPGFTCGVIEVFENHGQASRYKPLGEVSETVSAKYGTGGNNQPLVVSIGNGQMGNITMKPVANTLDTMHDQQAILCGEPRDQKSVVRRLTPKECERLQGFPDGWTDIGEWVDSKGKKHKEADSPRYKALGNSIALPFWQWMAKRISAQYERTPTMASLFDGIGGFPLVFSRAGVVPVWASEIEEFPMAVTKLRFPEE